MNNHDIVFIKNLRLEAIIGIYDHERINKQLIALNIEMAWDNRKAAETEDINDALDYEAVSNDLKDFIGSSTFLLVETLAEEIAKRLIDKFRTSSVMIELHKLNAIPDTDSVGVRIYRKKTA